MDNKDGKRGKLTGKLFQEIALTAFIQVARVALLLGAFFLLGLLFGVF